MCLSDEHVNLLFVLWLADGKLFELFNLDIFVSVIRKQVVFVLMKDSR